MKLQGSILAVHNTDNSIWENYLTSFHFTEIELVCEFNQFEVFQEYLNQEYFELANQYQFLRGIWQDEIASYIFDPEMTDSTDQEELFNFANLTKETIHSFTFENQSKTVKVSHNNHQEINEIHIVNNRIININGTFEELYESDLINQEEFIEHTTQKHNLNITPESNLLFKVYRLQWTKEYQDYFMKYIQISDENILKMSIPKENKKKPKWKFW